jgi:hypothetical protein
MEMQVSDVLHELSVAFIWGFFYFKWNFTAFLDAKKSGRKEAPRRQGGKEAPPPYSPTVIASEAKQSLPFTIGSFDFTTFRSG